MIRLIVSLWFVCGTVHAAPQMKSDNQGNPIISQYSEEGFVDCVFRIADLAETDTTYRFRLIGSYKGELVGMGVIVVKGIQAGMDSKMNSLKDHVYRKGVVFSRTGPESDRLISALAAMYGAKESPGKMVQTEAFTAIALHQGPIDMTNEQIKLKLFGHDGPTDREDHYNESFFNLDLRNRLVFWNEKDQEYRKPLLRALTK
jgi:hypothetical protein